jgi:hypothetical protein
MQIALQLLLLWALAFLTLVGALILLNVYYGLIDNDLTLRSLPQEAALAAVASLLEAGSVWLVIVYVPAAGRALIIPAVMVAMLYRVFHLEDWTNHDAVILFLLQIVIVAIGFFVLTGHVSVAILILVIVVGALALVGSIVRSL